MPSASSSGAPTPKSAKSSRNKERRRSVQRKDEEIAGILKVVEFHRMEMSAACLDRDILLCSDRISHWRTFERRAYVEAPQFFESLVVVSHYPTVLQGCQ